MGETELVDGLFEKYPALPALLFCGIIFAGYATLNLWKDPQQVKKSRYNLLFKLLGVAFLLFRYDIQDKGLPELLLVTSVLLCGLHLVEKSTEFRTIS